MRAARPLFFFLLMMVGGGCANIVPPSGGDRDTQPPKLLSVTPADSPLNIRPARVELRFDEYVQLGDQSALQISPLLPTPLTATASGRRVTVRIPDTALQDGTTYRISFGPAIQDLHEGNPFGEYAYTFSTGAYFDSLRLHGRVIRAETGLPDSGVVILLHPAAVNDTAVLRQKPLYTARVNALGEYTLEGLPPKAFRIYALGDGNNNLVADGGERIAFLDSMVAPSVAGDVAAVLRTFTEAGDTSLPAPRPQNAFTVRSSPSASLKRKEAFPYDVLIDKPADSATAVRVDISEPLAVAFVSPPKVLRTDRIFLSFDSLGVETETSVVSALDTPAAGNSVLTLSVAWRPDAAYTLRLLKGFAQDSSGNDAEPSRHRFRTKSLEDYGRLTIRIPSRYAGAGYVLQVVGEIDTVYSAPVLDSTVVLTTLRPGTYALRVVEDVNRNERWDPGELLLRRQPETTLPHSAPVPLKAGWDAMVDFVPVEPFRRSRQEADAQSR